MTRVRARHRYPRFRSQTALRLPWVHCHLGLPCHRAPLLCRTSQALAHVTSPPSPCSQLITTTTTTTTTTAPAAAAAAAAATPPPLARLPRPALTPPPDPP